MTRPVVDVSLYVLIDPEHAGGHALPELACAVVAGGASLLQLRDKRGNARAAVELGRAVLQALGPRSVPLLVNDRVDIAQAIGAAGVHLGQSDLAPADARAILGPEALIGETVKSEADVDNADAGLIDYVGLGGVFPTKSKDNPSIPLGIDGLKLRLERFDQRGFDRPIAAIAGITQNNAASVIEAGADGVCVISAVTGADPQAEAQALLDQIEKARARR